MSGGFLGISGFLPILIFMYANGHIGFRDQALGGLQFGSIDRIDRNNEPNLAYDICLHRHTKYLFQ